MGVLVPSLHIESTDSMIQMYGYEISHVIVVCYHPLLHGACFYPNSLQHLIENALLLFHWFLATGVAINL